MPDVSVMLLNETPFYSVYYMYVAMYVTMHCLIITRYKAISYLYDIYLTLCIPYVCWFSSIQSDILFVVSSAQIMCK